MAVIVWLLPIPTPKKRDDFVQVGDPNSAPRVQLPAREVVAC